MENLQEMPQNCAPERDRWEGVEARKNLGLASTKKNAPETGAFCTSEKSGRWKICD
jgi:hypothetical protein